jgi:hypothetical protein
VQSVRAGNISGIDSVHYYTKGGPPTSLKRCVPEGTHRFALHELLDRGHPEGVGALESGRPSPGRNVVVVSSLESILEGGSMTGTVLFMDLGQGDPASSEASEAVEPVLREMFGRRLVSVSDYSALSTELMASYELVISHHAHAASVEPTEAQMRALLIAVEAGLPYAALAGSSLVFRGQREAAQQLRKTQVAEDRRTMTMEPDRPAHGAYGVLIEDETPRLLQVEIERPQSSVTAGVRNFSINERMVMAIGDTRRAMVAARVGGLPVVHTADWGAGRVFVNALGVTGAAARDENVQRLIVQGLDWVIRRDS